MKRKQGFTLVEIMIVVAIIGLLAAIAVPSLLKARQETQRKLVVNNLRLIEDARDQVMTVSNYLDYTLMTTNMINPFLKSGSVDLMNWPGSLTFTETGVDLTADELVASIDIDGDGTPEEITTGRGIN